MPLLSTSEEIRKISFHCKKICRYIRMSLCMIKAWLILNYAHLIEYVFILSNIKYMLSLRLSLNQLIAIISLIMYIKLILLINTLI